MRKIYRDIALTIVCLFLSIKYTKVFLIFVAICAAIWFFILDDKKRKSIGDKVSGFFRRD